MHTPPLDHLVQRPTTYVPSHATTIDHMRQVMAAQRAKHPTPTVVRLPALVVDHVGGRHA